MTLAYADLMANALAPLINQCPKCAQPRGAHCSSGRYANAAVGIHVAREALIADLSQAERIAAYRELAAELEQRRQKSLAVLTGGAA